MSLCPSVVTYCMRCVWGPGRAGKSLSRIPARFTRIWPHPELVRHCHPECRFLSQSRIRAQILANSPSWSGSNQISYPANVSRIPHCILVKPRAREYPSRPCLSCDLRTCWNTMTYYGIRRCKRELPGKSDAFSQHLRLFLTLRKTGFLWFNLPCKAPFHEPVK